MTLEGFKQRWAKIDATDDPARYVGLNNLVRPTDDPDRYRATMEFVEAQPGERVLEVGCGNGAIARALACYAPLLEEIIAVDYSSAMIAEARRRSEGQDLPVPVTFAVADAQHLPFPDASFDRSYSMETFVILPDPRAAFEELARVTRPGGHICIWESECDTTAYNATDLELTRRIQRFIGDHEYNGAVARQIIGYCKEMGFEVSYQAGIGVREKGGFVLSNMLPEWLEDAIRAGVVTSEEADGWLADLRQRDAEGRFFSYLPHFRITAAKPG